jgi:glycosyltransferase involved in cell wall biosynthesis
MRERRIRQPRSGTAVTREHDVGSARIAILLPSFQGGGVERVMVSLADHFINRGHPVDVVVGDARGPLASSLPIAAQLVDLKTRRVLASLPALARYLLRAQPAVLLSPMDHVNLVALWARRLAGVSTRVVIGVPNVMSRGVLSAPHRRERWVPFLARGFYPWADAIIAVSAGVADDLARTTGLERSRIRVVYNPVVTPELLRLASAPVSHAWLAPGEPPVVLGAGRLTAQKDFPTLLRAFAQVRAGRPARLLILGEGEGRGELEALREDLGLSQNVDLPGYVPNPYAYMSRAGVFALSSAWEGFGLVLVEAMACGLPVVSTDCPGGPAEILESGAYGRLVPTGDARALAGAILATLSESPDRKALKRRADDFSLERSGDLYLKVLVET